ncbi:hypothetical protein EVAR_44606_1 [Eumeta japonica]|uniref:Uncharacterized protein n=1 Tax=Eumeta variegata TaxID=151549 RepID=A0A4C1X8U9_EUMVA|nr:hypothetical protein EVAR_44606_1 [Eumeta japonica]
MLALARPFRSRPRLDCPLYRRMNSVQAFLCTSELPEFARLGYLSPIYIYIQCQRKNGTNIPFLEAIAYCPPLTSEFGVQRRKRELVKRLAVVVGRPVGDSRGRLGHVLGKYITSLMEVYTENHLRGVSCTRNSLALNREQKFDSYRVHDLNLDFIGLSRNSTG